MGQGKFQGARRVTNSSLEFRKAIVCARIQPQRVKANKHVRSRVPFAGDPLRLGFTIKLIGRSAWLATGAVVVTGHQKPLCL